MRRALSEGVGLVPVSAMSATRAAFWTQLANSTSVTQPRDKIALLGDLIPLVAQLPDDEAAASSSRIRQFPAAVASISGELQERFRDLPPRDAACIATDLGLGEFLSSPLPADQAIRRVLAYVKVSLSPPPTSPPPTHCIHYTLYHILYIHLHIYTCTYTHTHRPWTRAEWSSWPRHVEWTFFSRNLTLSPADLKGT